MFRSFILAASMLCCQILLAQEVPPKPKIKFPEPVITIEPVKIPDGEINLVEGQLYIIESDTNFFLRASPKGLVTIEYTEGPMRFYSVFVDGSGKPETRTVQSKYIGILKAVPKASGLVEVLAIPEGIKSEDEIISQMIKIGHGPQPPPNPNDDDSDTEPEPEPEPEPDTVEAPEGFRVLFIYESSDNNTREQVNILRSTKIAEYLDAKCAKRADGSANGFPEWRIWDKDVQFAQTESPMLKSLWEASKSKIGTLPQIIIAKDRKGYVLPLPATEDATLQLIKKYAE